MSYKLNAVRGLVVFAAGFLIVFAYVFPVLNDVSTSTLACAILLAAAAAWAVYFLSGFERAALKGWRIPLCVILAVGFSMAIPVPTDSHIEVRIQATGQKNPASSASEVFVRVLPEMRGDVFSGNWEKRGDVYVSYKKQPNELIFRGEAGDGASLRFVRHPYSGIVDIVIPGREVQRLDLFSATESYVDVALPAVATAHHAYLRLFAIVLSVALSLSAIAQFFYLVSKRWCVTFLLISTTAIGIFCWVHGKSYAGGIELIAFDAAVAPVRMELNAGHGFTKELGRPIAVGGVVASTVDAAEADVLKLGISEGQLHFYYPMGRADAVGIDHACLNGAGALCVVEVRAAQPAQVWIEHMGRRTFVAMPDTAKPDGRRFLLLERGSKRLVVFSSAAYVQVSAWDGFSRWIRSLRLVDANGKPAAKLVRIVSEGGGSYSVLRFGQTTGEYMLEESPRRDTPSFIVMKVFAIVAGLSFVLLAMLFSKICAILWSQYRQGQRVAVLASVAGCILWLGLALLSGWPAVVGWDGLSPYIQAETGQINLWYGLGYPLLVGGFLLLAKGWVMTLWSCLVTLCLLMGSAAMCLQSNSALARRVAPFMLCVALPFSIIPLAMMTHLRDALNGLLLTGFAVAGFATALYWPVLHVRMRWALSLVLIVAGVIVVLLRIDNLPEILMLLIGLAFVATRVRVKSAVAILCIGLFWLAASPLLERYVMPEREAAAAEKRNYEATAVINPLVGMLVHGKNSLPAPLLADLRTSLDKVLDVAVAQKSWSPYNIIYWHETAGKRGIPDSMAIAKLRSLYVQVLLANPLLFVKLRLETFGATLGYSVSDLGIVHASDIGRYPNFHDHLLKNSAEWMHITQVAGFAPSAHPVEALAMAMQSWTSRIASSVLPLLICLLVIVRFKQNPLCGILALGAIARAGLFFFLEPAAVFLYLYDLHLMGFLLPMLLMAERAMRAAKATVT